MHSLPTYVHGYEEDRAQFGVHSSPHGQLRYDSLWTPVDPAVYQFQLEHSNPEYSYFQHVSSPFNGLPPRAPTKTESTSHISPYSPAVDFYRDYRYESPGGHLGGSMSEASSDYPVSPAMGRQQMTLSPPRYISPPAETQYSQHSWTTDNGFGLTPTSTPGSSQTHSVALKELEFQGRSDYAFEIQDDDIRAQLPLHVPEELELSDSIVGQPTTTGAVTSTPAHGHEDTDSSVSTPVHDNDSDSDFDPRRRSFRSNAPTRNPIPRSVRRFSSSTSYPTLDAHNRVYKIATGSRTAGGKEKSKPRPLPMLNKALQTSAATKGAKSFPCTFHTFGCPSAFANKNEWKRHVTSQHLQLGFYRCDLGLCNPDADRGLQTADQPPGTGHVNRSRGGHNKRRSPSGMQRLREGGSGEAKVYNDFNRKDLFTQHCRRMHGPARHLVDDTTNTNRAINDRVRAQGKKSSGGAGKPMSTKDDEAKFETELDAIRARCWTMRRYAPARSSCGFCGKLFEASTHVGRPLDAAGKAEERAWEERMEHLGRHYERDGCSASSEERDPDLLEWGLHEGILVEIDGVGPWLVDYDVPKPEPEEDVRRRNGLRRREARSTASGQKEHAPDQGSAFTSSGHDDHRDDDEDDDDDAMAEDD